MSRLRTTRAPLTGGLLLFALLALSGASTGCDVITSVGPKSCDRSEKANPVVTYSDGTVDGGIYMSSPWDSNLLFFPGGMQIRLEHKLGAWPRSIHTYLGFSENGVKGGPLSEGTGNSAEIVSVDEQAILVKNDTCADFWLLVTAEAGDAQPSSSSASGSSSSSTGP